jgi:ribosomal-protein-alanine N-acetyltransferase
MIHQEPKLSSKRLVLRGIEETDISDDYLGWLNDTTVNQYLEIRFQPQTLKSLKSYWQSLSEDPNSPWFAICLKDSMRHVGNIKLGPINWIHRKAELSLFIGERSCWGNGYASEAIALVRDWAYLTLGLQKLNAGMYAVNFGSQKAFEKCGFQVEGILRSEAISNGERVDVLRMGLTRADWLRGLS